MEGAFRAAGAPAAETRYRRADRVRTAEEIRHVLRNGRRRRLSALEVFFAPAPGARPRFGVIVPRHRNTIVRRNRLRRRLKEIGRVEVLPRLRAAGIPMDVLVRARREAYRSSFQELRHSLVEFSEGLCSRSSPSD